MEELFAKRLSELIQNSHSILADMEEAVGKKAATISRYASGEIKGVKRDTIVKLANFFNVSPAWLAGLSNERYTSISLDTINSTVIPIPILDTVSANPSDGSQKNMVGTINVEKNLIHEKADYFAFKIKEDSMAPIFIQDDIVIIKRTNNYENNEFVMVIIESHPGIFRKIKITDAGILLQPLNSAYEPLFFTKTEMKSIPITIIGVVKQLKREF